MLTEAQKEIILELFDYQDNLKAFIDLEHILNNKNIEDIEELTEAIQEEINYADIMYYSEALDYLKNNDTSLIRSLTLANDLGYLPKDLNSEILASLLLQDDLNDELILFINSVENENIF